MKALVCKCDTNAVQNMQTSCCSHQANINSRLRDPKLGNKSALCMIIESAFGRLMQQCTIRYNKPDKPLTSDSAMMETSHFFLQGCIMMYTSMWLGLLTVAKQCRQSCWSSKSLALCSPAPVQTILSVQLNCATADVLGMWLWLKDRCLNLLG